VSARYRSVVVYRDHPAMYGEHPLTKLEYLRAARVGEHARRHLRALMWTLLPAAALLGCAHPHRRDDRSGRGGWLSLLAAGVGAAAIGLGQRSSVLALQGIGAVAWLVTADPITAAEWLNGAVFASRCGSWGSGGGPLLPAGESARYGSSRPFAAGDVGFAAPADPVIREPADRTRRPATPTSTPPEAASTHPGTTRTAPA
jgi:hypothetical protein